MKYKAWGWLIETSDGISVIINSKNGCINVRDEIKDIIDMLMSPHREIKISWMSGDKG